MPEDRAELMDRFRAGESSAYFEIVHQHRQLLYRVARRILDSHADADEAVQQTFVRAWKARENFRAEATLRTWLTRIVLNVSRSIRTTTRPTEGTGSLEALPHPVESAEMKVNRDQLRIRVRLAVAALPKRQREVVVLKMFSEMTYKEVAAVMTISEGTAKAHFNQAVSNLKRLLGRNAEGRIR